MAMAMALPVLATPDAVNVPETVTLLLNVAAPLLANVSVLTCVLAACCLVQLPSVLL